MTTKLLAALAALAVSAAAQAGVLTYSGYLQNASGQPVTAATTITFRFYPSAAGGTAVWEDAVTVVPSSDGWFSAVLGGSAGNPLDAADFGQPLWLALQVASDAQEMTPRTRLGTAPYALTVDWSGVAGKPTTFPVDPATVQARVTGSCAAGTFVTGVNQDGTVACANDTSGAGDITAVAAGAGLTGGGVSGDVALAVDTSAIQARVTGACAAGTFVAAVNPDGSVLCTADDSGGTITGISTTGGLTGGATAGFVTLSTDGAIVARKDSAAGNQTFDGGTLHLDYANNRVGVNVTSPTSTLDVAGIAVANAYAYRSARTVTVTLPAVAFTVRQNGGFSYNFLRPTSGSSQFIADAPLAVPAGATLQSLTCEFYDNDASVDFTGGGVAIIPRAFGATANGAGFSVTVPATTGQSTAIITRTNTYPTLVDANSEYWVGVYLNMSAGTVTDLRFFGCRVTYTTMAPRD